MKSKKIDKYVKDKKKIKYKKLEVRRWPSMQIMDHEYIEREEACCNFVKKIYITLSIKLIWIPLEKKITDLEFEK